jgi:hypothetical protein
VCGRALTDNRARSQEPDADDDVRRNARIVQMCAHRRKRRGSSRDDQMRPKTGWFLRGLTLQTDCASEYRRPENSEQRRKAKLHPSALSRGGHVYLPPSALRDRRQVIHLLQEKRQLPELF